MTGPDANTQDARPAVTTHQLLGVAGLQPQNLRGAAHRSKVRQQAYTLAISDSFLLPATCCVACLVVVSLMSKVPTEYGQVTAAPAEAK
jgi:hypothetical protein